MEIRAIDHVQLAMPRGEEDRAREFYSNVLGLPEIAKAACRAAGLAPAHDTDLPGYRRFYVHDPFGNRLELVQEVDL